MRGEIRSEKAVAGRQTSSVLWPGAMGYVCVTLQGFVIATVCDRKCDLEIVLAGRRYRTRHKLREEPTFTGVVRMAGRFASEAAALAEVWSK